MRGVVVDTIAKDVMGAMGTDDECTQRGGGCKTNDFTPVNVEVYFVFSKSFAFDSDFQALRL